jgi:hypothetical protein
LMIPFGIFFTLLSPLYGGAIIIVAIMILLMLRKVPKS